MMRCRFLPEMPVRRVEISKMTVRAPTSNVTPSSAVTALFKSDAAQSGNQLTLVQTRPLSSSLERRAVGEVLFALNNAALVARLVLDGDQTVG